MRITRTVTALLSIALLSVMVTDVMAQGRGGRGQGGPGGGGQGGRGGGGFGGGGPGGGGRGGSSILGLLDVKEVQEEIELMEPQKEAIEKIKEESRGNQERPNIDRDASEEERNKVIAKMQKEREARDAKVLEQLEEVLFPEQLERVQQIGVQVLGTRALADKRVAAELKITDKQKEELEKVSTDARSEMGKKFQELRENGSGREEMMELMKGFGETVEKKTMGVLTSEQKKKFEELKGDAFEMPEQQGRGGFGGGRGGAGGGGRGGAGGGGRGGAGGGGRGGAGGGDRGGRQRPTAE